MSRNSGQKIEDNTLAVQPTPSSSIDVERQKLLADEMKAGDKTLPKFKNNDDGICELRVPDVERYSEMFGGSKSEAFVQAMAHACADVSGRGEQLREDKNHALAIVAEIAPRDGIEAMLATQMAAVHLASIRHSRQMASASTIPQLDIHERAFTKLNRTFTAQMEALRKHRHGGEQKMTVEHVTVQSGGQAIVGNIAKGGARKND